VLEDHPATVDDGAGDTREVLPRMEARLIVEAHARPADKRHLAQELGVEAEIGGHRRLVLE
jgi:hypothetical protein